MGSQIETCPAGSFPNRPPTFTVSSLQLFSPPEAPQTNIRIIRLCVDDSSCSCWSNKALRTASPDWIKAYEGKLRIVRSRNIKMAYDSTSYLAVPAMILGTYSHWRTWHEFVIVPHMYQRIRLLLKPELVPFATAGAVQYIVDLPC